MSTGLAAVEKIDAALRDKRPDLYARDTFVSLDDDGRVDSHAPGDDDGRDHGATSA